MRCAVEIMGDLAHTGLTPEQAKLLMELAAAVAVEAVVEARPIEDKSAQRRRARDRIYQAERRQNRQISAESADAPLNEDTSKPSSSSPEGSEERQTEPRAKSAFPKPDWADPDHWRDFMANRKRRRMTNSPTAYRAFIADIDRLTDDDWPPGKLLELAAGKGWGSINKPDQGFGNGRSNTVGGNRGQASGEARILAAGRAFVGRGAGSAPP